MSARVPLTMLLLVLVNAGLLTAVGWRLMQGSQREQLLQAQVTTPSMTFADIDAPAVARTDAIQARAIFHKSRSFYVAPPVQSTEQPPPEYRLAGAMTVSGKQTAVLISLQNGARTRVSTGDQVEGWTVTEILPGKVVLRFGDRTAEITTAARAQGVKLVTVIGPQDAVVPTATANGVRVIGNAPLGSPRPPAVTNGPLNQAPRFYRPPPQQQP